MVNFDTYVYEQSGYKKQSRLFRVWDFLFTSDVIVAGLTVAYTTVKAIKNTRSKGV
jgi:hypothetical protein